MIRISHVIAETPRYTLLAWADFSSTLAYAKGKADLVLMSPPYDDARTYGADVSWAFEDYHRLGQCVLDALRPGGHCLMVIDSPVREWRKGMGTERGFTPWRVMLDWAEMGFRVPDRMAYGRLGAPGAFTGRFRSGWEPLLWFQRPGSDGFFDKRSIATKAKTKMLRGQIVANRKTDGSFNKRAASGWAAENGMVMPTTFWDYGSVGGQDALGEATGHPARYAEDLAEDLIKCFCPPDGLAVDPFLGSGTSLVAALRHGRRFVGGDLLQNDQGISWASVALDRISKDPSIDPKHRPDERISKPFDEGLFA